MDVSMPHLFAALEIRWSEYCEPALRMDALDERLRVAEVRFSDADGVDVGAGADPGAVPA